MVSFFYLKSDLYFLYPTMKKLIILFLAISLSGCFTPKREIYATFTGEGDQKSLAYCVASSWVLDEYIHSNKSLELFILESRHGWGSFEIREGDWNHIEGNELVHIYYKGGFFARKPSFLTVNFWVDLTDHPMPLPEKSQRRLKLTKECTEMPQEKREKLFVNKDAPFAMYGDGR